MCVKSQIYIWEVKIRIQQMFFTRSNIDTAPAKFQRYSLIYGGHAGRNYAQINVCDRL